MPAGRIRGGCAGWGLPSVGAEAFPGPGSHLERYGRVLPAVEVNSSFYGPHQRGTWEVGGPASPGFANVQVRAITHVRRLRTPGPRRHSSPSRGPRASSAPSSCSCLGLAFDEGVAAVLLDGRAARDSVVCRPRHPTRFGRAAGGLLRGGGSPAYCRPACIAAARAAGGGGNRLAAWIATDVHLPIARFSGARGHAPPGPPCRDGVFRQHRARARWTQALLALCDRNPPSPR
jgi:hypothetical protein